MVFDRKKYMRNYYQKNKEKLKAYSNNYKKGTITNKRISITALEIKKGPITLSFD